MTDDKSLFSKSLAARSRMNVLVPHFGLSLESQVAQNSRPLYPKIAHAYGPLSFRRMRSWLGEGRAEWDSG